MVIKEMVKCMKIGCKNENALLIGQCYSEALYLCESCIDKNQGAELISEKENKLRQKNELIKQWLKIAQNNIWIKQRGSNDPNDSCAFEPKLTEKDFYECKNIVDLYNELIQGNWVLGQPFYYKDLCFINQVNGSDEFLVIRKNIEFESITPSAFSFEKFKKWLKRVFKASDKQLTMLEY